MNGRLVQHYLEPFTVAPDKVACTDGRQAITYGALADRSSRLANLLIHHGVQRQDRVAVCLGRSTDFLPAILGVLKADAVYVPLDPKSPPERWRQIITDCSPTAILCDCQTILPLGGAVNPSIPCIVLAPRSELTLTGADATATLDDLLVSPLCLPEYQNGPEDLAYILYTSGSTGTPKGVMITHGNIRNYIDWAVSYFDINSEDQILGTAPFHFDMSTFDLWCPLKAGATLCLADTPLTLFPEKLLRYMEVRGITLWKGISSLLFYMERAGVLAPGRIPSLSRVLFGGDALPARTLMQWMKVFPEKSFYNVYGPTEATGISLCYPVKENPLDAGARIPIGQPCKGMKAVLLDENRLPVSDGTLGELCLAGPGLGTGYLNDTDRTSRVFIQVGSSDTAFETWYHTGDLCIRRADGNYEFVGRLDQQVKIMGYRIELGEIEQALRAIEGVREAAVVTAQRAGVDELVAFIEGHEGTNHSAILSRLQGPAACLHDATALDFAGGPAPLRTRQD
ncbi:MAG: amino acid adenylation domain-containing protein [Syntrophotaleaceae bacterium]